MARKNVLIYQLENDRSLAVSFNTAPTLVKYLDNCAYQINATTAAVSGTFQVQVSLDYEVNEITNTVVNAGTWVPVTLAGGVPTLSGASDQIVINLNQLPFNAIRLAFTHTAGSPGTADIYIMCRQIGG